MIHNIIEVDGVEYQAVKNVKGNCIGCAGYDEYDLCSKLPPCTVSKRDDKSRSIYKRRINIKELQNAN